LTPAHDLRTGFNSLRGKPSDFSGVVQLGLVFDDVLEAGLRCYAGHLSPPIGSSVSARRTRSFNMPATTTQSKNKNTKSNNTTKFNKTARKSTSKKSPAKKAASKPTTKATAKPATKTTKSAKPAKAVKSTKTTTATTKNAGKKKFAAKSAFANMYGTGNSTFGTPATTFTFATRSNKKTARTRKAA
jgi:hypothetical protein